MPTLEKIEREIADVHDFFEHWFNADLDQTEENFDRFESVLDEDFVLIDIDADLTRHDDLLEAIWDGWGHPADEGRPITIETDSVELLRSEGDHHLATYIERQHTGGRGTVRRSSVLFRNAPGTPNALEWLYVQETPLTDS